MSRRMGLMLAVACVCGWLALCAGCREDLIDQTPVNEIGDAGLDAPLVDAAGAPEGLPAEVVPEGAETAQAADPAAADGLHADAPAPARGTDATPSRRSQGGSSGGDDGAQAAPTQPSQTPRRSGGGGGAQATPGPPAPIPVDRWVQGQPRSPLEVFDANGDGLLQRAELPERVRDRYMQADANADGALTADELRNVMPPPRRDGGGGEDLTPEQRRARMMERMDTNGDGKLTLAEMPERIRERMKAIDTNGDGVLSEQELEKARESWGQRRGGGGGQGGPGGRRGGGEQGDNN